MSGRIENIEHANDGIPNAPQPLAGRGRRKSLAQTLVAAAREPMAVLNSKFCITAANRSYYQLLPAHVQSSIVRPVRRPGAPNWSAFGLRTLHDVVALDLAADDVEIELDLADLGVRRMLLNARKVVDRENPEDAVVVGLSDVAALSPDAQSTEALRHAVLLQETYHRIANSLQIVASILQLKALSVGSEETRMHLRDAHKRLILIAAIQRQLCTAGTRGEIEFGPYLAKLCEDLAGSLTEGDGRIVILTSSNGGKVNTDDALSFGLIVTELVLNALKHGFPDGRRGAIAVTFEAGTAGWRLSVSDNGVGRPGDGKTVRVGLGTSIVDALARQLKARVEIARVAVGSATVIIHDERTQPAS